MASYLDMPLLAKAQSTESTDSHIGHLELETEHTVGPWWHVRDPDRFFRLVYNFYASKGYTNLVSKGILNHLTVLVVLFLLLFVTVAIDYKQLDERLNGDHCPDERVPLFSPDCKGNWPINLGRLRNLSAGVYILLFLFLLVWSISFFIFVRSLPAISGIKKFYETELGISRRRLQTIEWDLVMDKLVNAQQRLHIVQTDRQFTKLDITQLITRRANYRTALFSLGIIDDALRIPCFGKRIYLTKSLRLVMDWVLDAHVFEKNRIRPQVLTDDTQERQLAEADMARSFKFLGVMVLILSPLLIIARIAIFSFHHSEILQKSAGPLSTRHWSPYSRLRLRGYCEVNHIFYRRLSRSHQPASKYVSLFQSQLMSVWARFIGFTVGGFLVILIILGAVYDEDFLFEELTPERSVTWWLGLLGVIMTVIQGLIPDENLVFDPAEEMRKVVRHTHYFPDHWIDKEDSLDVLDEFSEMFRFKGLTLFEELIGVLLFMPYILFFKLPGQTPTLMRFFRECTRDVDGLGHVCRFAELQDTGKSEVQDIHASLSMGEFDERRDQTDIKHRTKMEWSMLWFKEHHNDWVPEGPGQAIIEESEETLRTEYPQEFAEHSLHEALLPHNPQSKPYDR
eukprot:m.94030 g.94030  ORF g.94030 m.94030 type:complete len:624 (-) comp13424_c0_seq6:61-1932(-)